MTIFISSILAFDILFNAIIYKEFNFNFFLWICCVIFSFIYCPYILITLFELMALMIIYLGLSKYEPNKTDITND